MQMRLTARVDQRQNCVYSVLQGCFAISLIEPQKTAGQLPQIISSVTDRKFAGSTEHVGGLPPKGRGLYSPANTRQHVCCGVNRDSLTMSESLPRFPDKQTFSVFVGMSQRCQEQTTGRRPFRF